MTSAELLEGAFLTVPLFLGFATHGVAIRFGLLRGLARPIDRGAMVRGRRLFGDNKTFRGVVCVAVGTALGFLILAPAAVASRYSHAPAGLLSLGAAVGAAAMLAELPNSALKRQLGIAPGAQASGMLAVAFHVLDQIDVLLGAWAVLATVLRPSSGRVLGSVACGYLGHQLITLIGYGLGMRATAR